MDAQAYLTKQGWRGHGHSLDRSDRGIKKPLLVSKKADVLGVGLNKHNAVSDQWWLRAFDQGLKDLGTGKESDLGKVQRLGHGRAGLYGKFVQGEGIGGTIGQRVLRSTDPSALLTPTDLKQPSPPADIMATNPSHPDGLSRISALSTANGLAGLEQKQGRKRKHDEQLAEKRAKRKTEHTEEAAAPAAPQETRVDEDEPADAATEVRSVNMSEIHRRVKELVLEAQKRGILAVGPNEIRKGLVSAHNTAPTTGRMAAASEELRAIVGNAATAVERSTKRSKKSSAKAQKYNRESMKRELKRAAKAYLLGEKTPQEMTQEERRAKRLKDKAERAVKREGEKNQRKEEAARKEERAREKRESRARRTAVKAETAKTLAEQNGVNVPGVPLEIGHDTDEFKAGTDSVPLSIGNSKKLKRVPGVGLVSSYPTKAEKRSRKHRAAAIENGTVQHLVQPGPQGDNAPQEGDEKRKVDLYRAMRHGLSLPQYREKLTKGELIIPKADTRSLSADKLAKYQKRADEKGVSLEEYMRRRDEKYAASQAEKLGNPLPNDTAVAGASAPDSDVVGFVVDTAGDAALTSHNSARSGVDTNQGEVFHFDPNDPGSLDPSLWKGKKIKDLPKALRKARKEWMAERRAVKKAAKLQKGAAQKPGMTDKQKSRGERKVEAREGFVKRILFESRQVRHLPESKKGRITIEGIKDVPLVKVETGEGMYTKQEVKLARTTARRVLRNSKKEEKAAKGKGKGMRKVLNKRGSA